MPEIVTERFENILRIQFNRPEKKNAMTLNMYSTVAELLNAAATDDETRVVLLHGAGDAFCAGNDLGDFLHNPLKGDDSPQARFLAALIEFDKPLIAAVLGVAIGGGTTMLTHFDFVYAAELGFVTRVVAEADRMATALDTAHRLTRQPAGAVRASKRLMRRVLGAQMAAASELEMREYASRLQSDDAKEAFTAFFEKRQPDFTKFKATARGPLQ